VVAAEKSSYYKVLGVEKDADAKAIKAAYRKMALKWHPDKNPDDRANAEVKFREVAEAYEVLSDPEKRKRYDHGGDDPSGFEFSGFGFKDAKDLFKEMFGDEDPFADFSKFFGNIFEEVYGEDEDPQETLKQARNTLEIALSEFYIAVGQHDKAPIEKVREVLSMPKWEGKEKKMLGPLKQKYAGGQHDQALAQLEKAFNTFAKSQSGFGGGDGSKFGDFDFGNLGGSFPHGFGNMFGGDVGGFESFFGSGGGGATFTSFTSTSSNGRTVKRESTMQGGRRVTKTIESDGTTTKATMEEAEGGRVRRKTGVKRADEALPAQDEI